MPHFTPSARHSGCIRQWWTSAVLGLSFKMFACTVASLFLEHVFMLPLYRISSTLGNRMHKKASSNQRDDVHVCIMCLRAIMNYQVEPHLPHVLEFISLPELTEFHLSQPFHSVLPQVFIIIMFDRHLLTHWLFMLFLFFQSGFNLVMIHPRCVNEITLGLNSRNPR